MCGSASAERVGAATFFPASGSSHHDRSMQRGSALLALALALASAGCAERRPDTAPSAEAVTTTEPEASGARSTASAEASAPLASATASPAGSASAPSADASAVPASEGMVRVPEGIFLMGGEGSENGPRHRVAVAAFELDVTEVTVGAYARCVAQGRCAPAKLDNPFCNGHFEGREEHPVNCVDHRDATSYCGFVGKRLPTEREWEYAARGGAEQRLYAWGNEEPDRSRSCYMHEGGSCEVGRYAPDAFGTRDLTGNVWEWTASAFLPYPAEASEGLFYVYRGGSWSRRFAKWMRNDLRNRYRPEQQSASLGFRCARELRPLRCPLGSEPREGRCELPEEPTSRCPRGTFLEGEACKPMGGGSLARSDAPPATASAAVAPPAPERPVRARSPAHDGDCSSHYPGKPVAYQWSGGRFEEREPLIAQAGCVKRDIGPGWTSACCAR